MKILRITIAVFYAICAIIAFGVAFHRTECLFGESRNQCNDLRVMSSLLSAIAWPLYLSVIVQENA